MSIIITTPPLGMENHPWSAADTAAQKAAKIERARQKAYAAKIEADMTKAAKK